MTNCCSWAPQSVTLHDGRTVLSTSEEWRAQCEAVWLLKLGHVKQMEAIEQRKNRRGSDAVAALVQVMEAVEPTFVLDYLPTKELRHGYIRLVRLNRGPHEADRLTFQVKQLLDQRRQRDEPLSARAFAQAS